MIAAALSFGSPSYASQYSLAGCDSVLNVMDFKHFSPLHAAPCFSMMAFTCCSLNAFPLKNRPSEMMLPGLKSYCVCNCSCDATASSTCTRQPTNRTNPTINASATILAISVSPTMRMLFWGVCFFPGVTEFGEAWLLVFLGFAVVFCCGGCFACHRASLYRVWLIVCLTIDSSID